MFYISLYSSPTTHSPAAFPPPTVTVTSCVQHSLAFLFIQFQCICVFLQSIYFHSSYLKLYKKGILLCIIFWDFFVLNILLRFIHFACRYSTFWLCVNIPMCGYSTVYSSTLSWMGIWAVPAVRACEQCSSVLCVTSRAHAQKCWSNSYAVVQRWRGIVKLGSNTSSMFFDDVFPFQ